MGFNRRFCQGFGGSLATLALAVSPALAEELHDWAFDTATSELTFALSDEVFPEFFLLSEPPRLVLDIPNTEIGTIEPEQIYNGSVQAIRVAQHTPDQVRVVIELTPGIVLSPDQADIQFDDGEGLRHWRFRPLIADNDTAVALSNTPTLPPSSGQRVSLSAANLQLSSQQSTATELPIDPYAAEVSNTVVSVPPLEEALSAAASNTVASVPPLEEALSAEVPNTVASVPPLEDNLSAAASNTVASVPPLEDNLSAAASNTVANVPPLESLPVDTAHAPAVETAVISTVPDLPPMTVPELEEPEVNNSALDQTETPTAAVPAHNRSSLPDISARIPSGAPDVIEPVPNSPMPELRGESAEIEPAPLEVNPALEEVPTAEVLPVAEVAEAEVPADEVPPMAEVPTAEVLPMAEVPVVAAVAANSVPVPPVHTESVPVEQPGTESEQPMAEPMPVEAPITESEQPGAQQPRTTTGLAPVELSLLETPVAEDDGEAEATLETIQQPAARRTITQTQQPAPLTFGQPLPDAAH